ncbi:hypothetical protein EJ05DRAFT_373959 [Pseudovirgaria hyperparasitica]|uniref:Glycosyltransferase family 31 protein n=1 Tax=Pseudovirgaria hyperparasitica TaxID=470096 RepID=A0A6A6W7K3_9PEZI|nr:uncharacterized protein EJ05DRAFT_373959 [Pseudovirgaria hyperparasitica]KAF2758004.1 hypothetical protein EJ05DRAFT_373959 [Pseudovirgaria hyperparasitica]
MVLARLTSKPALLVLPVLLLFIIAYHLSSNHHFPTPTIPQLSVPRHCSPNLARLQQLKLSAEINYGRAAINVRYAASTSQPEQFQLPLPEFNKMRVHEHVEGSEPPQCPEPFMLSYDTPPPPPDLSHIIFGAATTIDRLEASFYDFAHWISGTNALLYAILEPAAAPDIERLKERAKSMGFRLTVEESELDWHRRYFTLTRRFYEHHTSTTKWGIIIDDDTFFISPTRLSSFLASFDHTQKYYIGGVTEDFGQIKNFGIFGYGGASNILSIPLLAELNGLYDVCVKEETGGDIMLARCLYGHTGTKLTMEHRLHQFDMNGDLSGIYESGRRRPQMLSVHHWKSWHQANMTNMAAVSSVCGDECLLQRFKFADGWWLTNGYSLVKYSKDLSLDDVTIEHTWRENGDYWHSFDPLRPKDEGKTSLRLELVERTENSVSQFYVQRKEGLDHVFEMVWTTT